MLSCRPQDDHFRCNDDVSHDRHTPTEHGPWTILGTWDIWMDSDPSAGEYGGEAAPNYMPYRPGVEYIGAVG